MNDIKSLASILRNLNENDSNSILFDSFDNNSNTCLSYRNLKNIFKMFDENLFSKIKKNSLIVFYVKNWNEKFYKLFLSSIYCYNAYFIIDFRWPIDYVKSVIERVNSDYVILDQDSEFSSLDAHDCIKNEFIESLNYKILSSKISYEKPRDLAYVITTSGTTGKPKVIEVCNSSIVPNINDICQILDLKENDIFYQASSLTFDPSLIEIFCSLKSGACLLVLPQVLKMMPRKLNQILLSHKISTLQVTPSLFKILDEKIFEKSEFKNLLLGGEIFPICKLIKKLIIDNKRVFNIYGLTELSCWSSCHLISLNDLEDPDGVPIEPVLSETKFYIKIDNSYIEFQRLDNQILEGELYHFSIERICYVNGSRKDYVGSGDNAIVKNGRLYLKGRSDRLVKINANLTDLNLLEKTLKDIDKENLKLVAFLLQENYLALAIFCDLELAERRFLSESIKDLISKKLPFNYQPRRIFFFDSDYLPITFHGKINYEKLKKIALTYEAEENCMETFDLFQILKNIWQKLLGKDPDNEDKFVLSGGDSLKALIFVEELENEFKRNNVMCNTSLILDLLLNEKFSKLIQIIQNIILKNQNTNQTGANVSKKPRLENSLENDEMHYFNQNIISIMSKNLKYVNKNYKKKSENKKLDFKLVWKADTKKCVDSTLLLIADQIDDLEKYSITIYGGSHSHFFYCIDGLSGKIKWTFEAFDRIESSACIDKSGRFVIFGSYDNYLYVLNSTNGDLHFKFKAQNCIKSSPCVDYEKGFVYFGSYDKNIYCIDIEKKYLVWNRILDNSSIFSGPTCDNEKSLFVTTLGGNLFCLNKNNGDLEWKIELDKPCFTSPILNLKNSRIFVATCGGNIYCIDFSGNIKWTYKVSKPIFSNTCLIDDMIAFGCHDHKFYCLDQSSGQIKWTFDCETEIYSTPFYVESMKAVTCINCDGTVFIFNLNGILIKKKKIFENKNSCYSSPLIFESYLYIGSRDNHIYCLEYI